MVLYCRQIASFVRVYNLGVAKESSAHRLKTALVTSFLGRDLTFFEQAGPGELLTTLHKDVVTTADILADKMPSALRSFNSAVLGSVFLFRVSPYLCGVSLSVFPLMAVVVVGLSKSSSRLTATLRDLEKEATVFVNERLQNVATVFVNGTQAEECKNFNRFGENILSKSRSKYLINGLKMGFINIATNASIIAVLYSGAIMVGKQEISQGELTSFLMRSGFVGLGFSSMASSFSDLSTSLAAAAR
jgi:ABC-type multidrug transport system fused ATPase/permease subunit